MDQDLHMLRTKSLLATWLIFVAMNILSKTVQVLFLINFGRVNPLEENLGWVSIFLGFLLHNVPDLCSIAIYMHLKWVAVYRKNSKVLPHLQQQQQKLGALPVHRSEEDECYYHGIYVGAPASASASVGVFPAGVEPPDAPSVAGEQVPSQVFSKNAKDMS